MQETSFTVTFRGVRGSFPITSPAMQHYGGNTSCVEVRCGGRTIVLDAGTGLYSLGNALEDRSVDLLLSHTHIDHLIGLLFFAPAYESGCHIRLWAGHLLPEGTLEEAIDRLMSPPLFPLTRRVFKARMEYRNFRAGETLGSPFAEDGIRIETLPLNHPDRATGYRITYNGISLCYITDIEHDPNVIDESLVAFLRGADCMIYDATYDDGEFAQHAGWGHSTWQQAIRLKQAAGVEKLALFHHDPRADDATLRAREQAARAIDADILMAREGLALNL